MRRFGRVILIVLDSVGIGAAPDAKQFGDVGADTLGHISQCFPNGLQIPEMTRLGLGNIRTDNPLRGIPVQKELISVVGKMKEVSAGKDSINGHWELMGVPISRPLNTFPNGFPTSLIDQIEHFSNRKVILNQVSSGMKAIQDFGERQKAEGSLIIYTTGDSVLQIAAHEDSVPVEELYRICRFIRTIVDQSELTVGRIIARPFIGRNRNNFERSNNRKDFSMVSTEETVLDLLTANGISVTGIGKVNDIFSSRGIEREIHTSSNLEGMDETIHAMRITSQGFVFVNLVDFDSKFGHCRDAQGYGEELARVDNKLKEVLQLITDNDLLIITADHGNDPTFKGTDHTREFVPIIAYSKEVVGKNIGVRNTYSDVGATILDNFRIDNKGYGESFLNQLSL
ncbi:phosphopentomutase [Levilactobacillus angrenensis]|uniref:Phosphopentomutase n=1 Tax=Levilactobacillus angrenensis TaxID=2486020 RepID=A0ABW1UAX5_9LACO|nr:phosphopentomutase [Levilactobacillus angrenensis]